MLLHIENVIWPILIKINNMENSDRIAQLEKTVSELVAKIKELQNENTRIGEHILILSKNSVETNKNVDALTDASGLVNQCLAKLAARS